MSSDRLTRLLIQGMRSIKDADLALDGLTVLIGDNGSGKSTLVEALELLGKAATPGPYTAQAVQRAHGGLANLMRGGESELTLGVTIEGEDPKLEYSFSLALDGAAAVVSQEKLDVYAKPGSPEPLHALTRRGKESRVFDTKKGALVDFRVGEQALAVTSFGVTAQPAFQRVIDVLAGIEVQSAFETRPLWLQQEIGVQIGPRWPVVLEDDDRVARFGVNLGNCYQALRNKGGAAWERVLDLARLGLGSDFRDILLKPASRGQVDLEIVLDRLPIRPVPARLLSEGQLAYLLFVALAELPSGRTMLAVDEPECHMHPELLGRVLSLLQRAASHSPVVVATQSDRLLDALEAPAESVVLCELDAERATTLRRPNAKALAEWLSDYRGLGTLRSEGYEAHVFDSSEAPSSTPGERVSEDGDPGCS